MFHTDQQKNSAQTHEVELRFRLSDPASIVRVLASLAGEPETRQVVDHWMAPADVTDYDSHERWLASLAPPPLRIRETWSSEGSLVQLDVKRPLRTDDFGENIEVSLPVADFAAAAAFVAVLGYHVLATLRKTRQTWRIENIAVCLDCYEDYGHILELESLVADTASARSELGDLTRSLDLSAYPPLTASSAVTVIRHLLDRSATT